MNLSLSVGAGESYSLRLVFSFQKSAGSINVAERRPTVKTLLNTVIVVAVLVAI